MQIELVRTGGLGNLRLRKSLDTDSLSPDDRREVEELVERLDLEGLEQRSPIRGRGADRFQYDMTFISERGRHEVSVGEGATPPELRSLIKWLLRKGGK